MRYPTTRITSVLLALLAACRADLPRPPLSDGEGSATVTDQAGRVFSTSTPPGRVVSLVPSATQVLVALGVGDRLVARTDYDTAEAVEDLPTVGGGLDPSIEVLVSLHPELVIRFLGQADQRTPARLDQLGIPHFAVHPERIDDVRTMVRDLGVLTGRAAQADSIVAAIDRSIASIRQRVADRQRPSVAFLLDGTPTWAAGSSTFVGELIEIAGGANAFEDLDRPWVPVSAEELVSRPLDLVLTPEGSHPGGVPPGVPIIQVSALTQLPGPRLADAAEELARVLHPSVFQ